MALMQLVDGPVAATTAVDDAASKPAKSRAKAKAKSAAAAGAGDAAEPTKPKRTRKKAAAG